MCYSKYFQVGYNFLICMYQKISPTGSPQIMGGGVKLETIKTQKITKKIYKERERERER